MTREEMNEKAIAGIDRVIGEKVEEHFKNSGVSVNGIESVNINGIELVNMVKDEFYVRPEARQLFLDTVCERVSRYFASLAPDHGGE